MTLFQQWPFFPAQKLKVNIQKSLPFSYFAFFLLLFIYLASMTIIFPGCRSELPAPPVKETQETVIEALPPMHFIVCIDNSRSIRPPEQKLIRETTMLLADLADQGDRMSVVTFGRGAGLKASSQIHNDNDRVAFKNQVKRALDFDENFSDIRACIRFLAEDQRSPMENKELRPYVILLSDGKLEPEDGKIQEAFNEMKGLLEGMLSIMGLYAVVLGNTYCNDVILQNTDGTPLDGKKIMMECIASSTEHFFHAKSMDQLLRIVVNILNKAKGITSIAEETSQNRFRIDNSVETMTLIVRKRSTDGTRLCDSTDVNLNRPDTGPCDRDESIYRSSYEYFDLMVVRNPREGIWSVTLADESIPEVLSKISTPLELRFSYKKKYFLNEFSTLSAWIFDKKGSQVVKDQTFQIRAKLSQTGTLEGSNVYADFNHDLNSGQYILEVPEGMTEMLDVNGDPFIVTMELIAQRFEPQTEEPDPWFIRRSCIFTIDFCEPFCEWSIQAARIIKLPFRDKALAFGSVLDTSHSRYPEFEVPPKLIASLERFDEKEKALMPVFEKEIKESVEQANLIYQEETPMNSMKKGMYCYAYQLKGVLKDGGPFSIKSPQYCFTVTSYSYDSWVFWILLATIITFIFCLFYSSSAKIKGTLMTNGTPLGLNTKIYRSEDVYQNRFTLKAKRGCFQRPRIILKVIQGTVLVDGIPRGKGEKGELSPGVEHTIEHSEAGRTIKRQLIANV